MSPLWNIVLWFASLGVVGVLGYMHGRRDSELESSETTVSLLRRIAELERRGKS